MPQSPPLYFPRMTKGIATETSGADEASGEKLLIVGFGDIGARVAANLLHPRRAAPEFSIAALVRRADRVPSAHALGVEPLLGDLSDAPSLAIVSDASPTVLMHFAPPPSDGKEDTHTRHLLAALERQPPKRIVYISTTGVYGDCRGAWIDESAPLLPLTARAQRRVDAEQQLQAWCAARAVRLVVLRAPGIYADDRLPLARIQAGTPALRADEDVYSNHIHAEDLASACISALTATQSGTFNIVDDEPMKMGDYFDLVADHFYLTRPPRVARADAVRQIAAPLLSFMSESRRIRNDKAKRELGWALRYPSVTDFLSELRARS
jgi:nucleoside-diphosphate-sugar epimerase